MQGSVCLYGAPEVTWREKDVHLRDLAIELSVFLGQVSDMETTGRECTHLWQGFSIILSLYKTIKWLHGGKAQFEHE